MIHFMTVKVKLAVTSSSVVPPKSTFVPLRYLELGL